MNPSSSKYPRLLLFCLGIIKLINANKKVEFGCCERLLLGFERESPGPKGAGISGWITGSSANHTNVADLLHPETASV